MGILPNMHDNKITSLRIAQRSIKSFHQTVYLKHLWKDALSYEQYLHATNQFASFTRPTAVPLKNRYSSGYVWRNVELTRQDLLCLMVFAQGIDNYSASRILGVSVQTVNARSTSLRHRLGFDNKKAMVAATQQANFLTIFPAPLIDALFDGLTRKKHRASKACNSK